MHFKKFGAVAAVAASIALAGCNPAIELEDADKAVAEFHQRFGAENYDAIWTRSHERLRQSSTREEFDRLMAGLHDYWGKVKSTEREGFNINTNNGVTTVKVTHNTTFENGAAVEMFNFVRADEELQLMGYDIKTGEQPAANDEEIETEKEGAAQ